MDENYGLPNNPANAAGEKDVLLEDDGNKASNPAKTAEADDGGMPKPMSPARKKLMSMDLEKVQDAELRDILKEFDTDGDSKMSQAEVIKAAAMLKSSRHETTVYRNFGICLFILLLISTIATVTLVNRQIKLSKETTIGDLGIMKSKDSGETVQVKEEEAQYDINARMPDDEFLALRKLVFPSTTDREMLEVAIEWRNREQIDDDVYQIEFGTPLGNMIVQENGDFVLTGQLQTMIPPNPQGGRRRLQTLSPGNTCPCGTNCIGTGSTPVSSNAVPASDDRRRRMMVGVDAEMQFTEEEYSGPFYTTTRVGAEAGYVPHKFRAVHDPLSRRLQSSTPSTWNSVLPVRYTNGGPYGWTKVSITTTQNINCNCGGITSTAGDTTCVDNDQWPGFPSPGMPSLIHKCSYWRNAYFGVCTQIAQNWGYTPAEVATIERECCNTCSNPRPCDMAYMALKGMEGFARMNWNDQPVLAHGETYTFKEVGTYWGIGYGYTCDIASLTVACDNGYFGPKPQCSPYVPPPSNQVTACNQHTDEASCLAATDNPNRFDPKCTQETDIEGGNCEDMTGCRWNADLVNLAAYSVKSTPPPKCYGCTGPDTPEFSFVAGHDGHTYTCNEFAGWNCWDGNDDGSGMIQWWKMRGFTKAEMDDVRENCCQTCGRFKARGCMMYNNKDGLRGEDKHWTVSGVLNTKFTMHAGFTVPKVSCNKDGISISHNRPFAYIELTSVGYTCDHLHYTCIDGTQYRTSTAGGLWGTQNYLTNPTWEYQLDSNGERFTDLATGKWAINILDTANITPCPDGSYTCPPKCNHPNTMAPSPSPTDAPVIPWSRCDARKMDSSCCTSSQPCDIDEGDCDSDADCAGNLVCGQDNSAPVYSGAPYWFDLCEMTPAPVPAPVVIPATPSTGAGGSSPGNAVIGTPGTVWHMHDGECHSPIQGKSGISISNLDMAYWSGTTHDDCRILCEDAAIRLSSTCAAYQFMNYYGWDMCITYDNQQGITTSVDNPSYTGEKCYILQ